MCYYSLMKKIDFLADFVGNPARARVLRVFVINESEAYTPALMAKRTGLSTVAVVREIKALEKLNVIKSSKAIVAADTVAGKKRATKIPVQKSQAVWSYDTSFIHARGISAFVHEVSPAQYDEVTNALKRTGRLATVVLSGNFMGDPTRPADLLVAADGINEGRLQTAVKGLELIFGREIRYAAFSTPEFRYRLTIQDRLLRDTFDFPHMILMDRTRLL